MSNEEQSTAILKKLRIVRGGNRGVVTKHENESNDIIMNCTDPNKSKENLIQINSIATTLKDKRHCLKALDEAILEKTELEFIEKEIDEPNDWETKIHECVEKSEVFKRGDFIAVQPLSQVDNQGQGPSTVHDTTIDQRENGILFEAGEGVMNTSQISDGNLLATSIPGISNRSILSTSGVRLPKINVPTFNGEQTQFQLFWECFDCAFHSNECISKVHKLNYLINALEGKAHQAIAGVQLKNENYDHTIKILKDRFGNKQQIISSHMQALLSLQGLPNERVSQLRLIIDQINTHVRGLDTLGVTAERYGSLLIPVIMSRMPKEITIIVARKITEDIWPIEEILDIICHEIEAREYSENLAPEKRQPQNLHPKSSQGTARTFGTKGERRERTQERSITWYFCDGDHLSIDCQGVKDPQERQELLNKAGRCYKCMKTGHTAKNCDKKCRKCSGNHHQAICFKARSESKIGKTVTATSKGEVKVMLQTARAYAFGEDKSKGVMVNVFLDRGSQKNYITEQLAKKLSLNTENVEQLHVTTFGSERFEQKKCNVVTVNLDLADNSKIAISALSYPVICSPISSSVDVREFPHLRSLSLADSPSAQERRIDMLIGMNYYYQIVTGEVVTGKSGPVALNIKLGWLLSGPYDVYSDNKVRTCSNVSSHLILNCALKNRQKYKTP